MATPIIMPRQGQSVESCIITSWSKKVGDTVEKGEILFSYETDKSSFDEVAPESGKLLAIFHEEGDDVPCLENVCVIGADGEDYSQFAPAAEADIANESAPEAAPAAEVKVEATEAAPVAATAAVESSGAISPRARALAEKTGADLLKATPTGPNGRIIERDVMSLVDRGLTVSGAASAEYTTPVEGSGISGKVMLGDVHAPKAPTAAVSNLPEYEDVKLPNIRKIIAKQMCASLSTMAQLTLSTSFDATKVLELRKSLKAGGEKFGLPNITLNDVVLYAVSRTVLNHKSLNAHCLDDTMRYFNTVNLGIAVDSPRGLIVPTLFHAETLSLTELSKEAKSVISAAQGGSISPDFLKGGTITISNLGSMGIETFTPIINPPQTALLGVGCIQRRVKEVQGEDVFYSAMNLSLTVDHRVVDGADAARFLKDLVFNLENFDLLLLAK